MDNIIWKKINEEGSKLYEISNTGLVRSLDSYDSWDRLRKGKVLKYTLDERGYPRIRLTLNNIKCSLRIHRLVAKHFIPNPNNLPQVNHIDGNKLNNHHSNLEWCDNSYNQKHAIDIRLKITKKGNESPRFRGNIIVYDLNNNVVDILYGNEDMKNKGYDYRNVSAVVLGKRKTYKNLIFKRDEKN